MDESGYWEMIPLSPVNGSFFLTVQPIPFHVRGKERREERGERRKERREEGGEESLLVQFRSGRGGKRRFRNLLNPTDL